MENKIDRRRHYILVLDTETANTNPGPDGKLDSTNCLVYDVGFQVVDKHGNVYQKASYVNSDIFFHERQLMASAYYTDKIPKYWEDIRAGRRVVADTYTIKRAIHMAIEKYQIKEVAAHNALFDYNALNATQRWVTKSKYRYFLPYGIEVWDTMKMARSVILKMPTYKRFCEEHNLLTKTGKLPVNAQALTCYIRKDPSFIESHTGLEDVEVETQILAYCYRQHKKMQKKLFKDEKTY